MTKASGPITINCTCGEDFVATIPALDYEELVAITHDCGQATYVGAVIDRESDVVPPVLTLAQARVAKSEVPKVFINVHGGEVLCRDHAGSQLSAAIAAKPRASVYRTSFGDWVRANMEDVASWKMSGLTLGCESCAERARRAA
jgi:hypothetical protein